MGQPRKPFKIRLIFFFISRLDQKSSNHYLMVILNCPKTGFLLDRKAIDLIKLNYWTQSVSGNLVACVGFSLQAISSVLGQEMEVESVNRNKTLVETWAYYAKD